ncbi:MAG: hypothetical protein RIR26_2675, partial [Pseudomonadota bacterium]
MKVNEKMKRHLKQTLSPMCSLLVLMALTAGVEGCKPQPEISTATTLSADQDSDDAFELLTAKQNTVLKSTLMQSGSQSEGAVCPIPEGAVLTLDAIKPEGVDHWRVFRLSAIKLPSGEVGRRAETPDVTPTPAAGAAQLTSPQLQSQVPLQAPQIQHPISSTSTPNEPVLPASSPSSESRKTPAQLLNCALLDADSFLVFSPHFSRQIANAQRSVKPDSGVSDA